MNTYIASKSEQETHIETLILEIFTKYRYEGSHLLCLVKGNPFRPVVRDHRFIDAD